MPKVEVHTYGCKVNAYDSGLIEQSLGEVSGPVHVLNSCAVTEEASREAARESRRIKRKDPNATVVVTGCAAQVDSELLAKEGAFDLIVANSHKPQLAELIQKTVDDSLKQKTPLIHKSNIFEKTDLGAGGGLIQGRTRSFLKVQDGCNSFCTFCVIPFARGKSRSIPIDQCLERVNELASEGIREVVLTGIHLGDYQDNEGSLESLLETLLTFTSQVRFRISSLEPPELTDRLLDLFKEERVCSHFHMSIQSAEDEVLRAMKRQYTSREVADSLERIDKNITDAFVGMDVIVGFPNETASRFETTYQNLSRLPWSRIHVFPYSERKGTFATRLKETVPYPERKERAKKLRQLSHERWEAQALKQIGQVKSVIALDEKKGRGRVLSDDYWNITTHHPPQSRMGRVRIEKWDDQKGLLGEWLS